MNEMVLLAEAFGVDIDSVRRGIGSDPRIGSHFFHAGCGYGGSCFPKDVAALSRAAKEAGIRMDMPGAVEAANEHQTHLLIARIEARFGTDLSGLVFALWGLAFKPDTDDMREAPSQVLVRELANRGASIQAYDPVAMNEARRILADVDTLSFRAHATDVLKGADALVIVTGWKEFRSPDLEYMKPLLRQPIVFDGRNILEPDAARAAGLESGSDAHGLFSPIACIDSPIDLGSCKTAGFCACAHDE